MKCAGDHTTTACRKHRQEDPKCANCSGKHVSCDKGCAAYKKARSHLRANRLIGEQQYQQQRQQPQQQTEKQRPQQKHNKHQRTQQQQHQQQSQQTQRQGRQQQQQQLATISGSGRPSYSRVVRSGITEQEQQQQQPRADNHQQQHRRPQQQQQPYVRTVEQQQPSQRKRPQQQQHQRQQRARVVQGAKAAPAPTPIAAATPNTRRPLYSQGAQANPAENHLAKFQQKLRDEQQQHHHQQQQEQQKTLPANFQSHAHKENAEFLSRLEAKIDSLFSAIVKLININTNKTSKTTNSSSPNSLDMVLSSANDAFYV
ncbi:GL21457 [Drosophila persimilis]|uniref:GL21457 n=1 Tax=Drosophila persimilis TaxID=7234 RepID=B4IRL3_DROPE|nr:GL21457 [Drosophila persimilis]